MFSLVPCGFPTCRNLIINHCQVWLLHSYGDAHFSSKFGQSSLYACEVIKFQPVLTNMCYQSSCPIKAGFYIIVSVVRIVSVASNFWDDPYARIVSIARIASVVWEVRFHIIVSLASKNLKRQRRSLQQKQLYEQALLCKTISKLQNSLKKNSTLSLSY